MSYRIGIDTIHLRPTERLAHTEYCSSDPVRRVLTAGGAQSFEDAFAMDLIWNTNDGPAPWGERGRVTDMGHAAFLEGGVDKRPPKPSPFKNVKEVLAFDAAAEYGIPDRDELAAYYEQHYQQSQAASPNQVFTGGYYKTIISGAIEAFGWDRLLEAAADQDRFERVLDSIYRLSLRHYEAWAKTRAKVFISHDDIVWSQGAFMDPAFYRRALFPRYASLWSVLKDAGKKVLFCSDGNLSAFIDDIAAAGADGFIFEAMTQLEPVVARYGKTHVIVSGKMDCRTLTYGSRDAIKAEVDATIELARDCPGFIAAVGNHIPSNIPVENVLFYFDYLKAHWKRDCP